MPRKRSDADTLNRWEAVVVSCEHAGHAVPRAYRYLFAASPSVLTTHRGYDIGIAPVAQQVAKTLACPFWPCNTSRLLIEPNRSLHHRHLFSQFSRDLPAAEKRWLIEHIWQPHRNAVTESVRETACRHGRVLHLAMHSFTPIFEGQIRTADIGLLYDPQRHREAHLAKTLQEALREATNLRIRRNYPYQGRADGLTTALRRQFDPGTYLGLEIEFNQDVLASAKSRLSQLASIFSEAIGNSRHK